MPESVVMVMTAQKKGEMLKVDCGAKLKEGKPIGNKEGAKYKRIPN